MQRGGASIALTDAASLSPPRSLVLDLSAVGDASVKRQAFLSKTFGGAMKSAVVEFDMRAASFTANVVNFVEVALDVTAPELSYYSVGVGEDENNTVAFEYREYTDGGIVASVPLAPAIPTTTWSHVKLVVTVAPVAGYVLYLDGARVLTAPISPPAYTGVTLYLGITSTNEPAGPARYFIDNLTFDRTL